MLGTIKNSRYESCDKFRETLSNNCDLNNKGLKHKSENIGVFWNGIITNIIHITDLEILDITRHYDIDSKCILNLKILNICDNSKITNINHTANPE